MSASPASASPSRQRWRRPRSSATKATIPRKDKATVPLSDSPPAESYQREMDRVHEYEGGELVGTELEGRYRIERRIGSGGMGTVYLAQQLSLRMPVAVKVLSHECS